MRSLKYLQNNTLNFHEEKCIGCGMCMEVCPHGVFSKNDKKVKIENKKYCMECGACKKNCPSGAIDVDAGVGCASAVITGILTGSAPVCGCSADENKNSCC